MQTPSLKMYILMVWYGRISKPKDRRPIVIRQYVPILGDGAILKHTKYAIDGVAHIMGRDKLLWLR
jgi:hypothetical protein